MGNPGSDLQKLLNEERVGVAGTRTRVCDTVHVDRHCSVNNYPNGAAKHWTLVYRAALKVLVT